MGPYVVDFYCPELRLVIEVDGPSHQNDQAVIYDAHRQRELEKLGLHFLRVTNHQVFHEMDNVMEMVLATVEALRERKKADARSQTQGNHTQ